MVLEKKHMTYVNNLRRQQGLWCIFTKGNSGILQMSYHILDDVLHTSYIHQYITYRYLYFHIFTYMVCVIRCNVMLANRTSIDWNDTYKIRLGEHEIIEGTFIINIIHHMTEIMCN